MLSPSHTAIPPYWVQAAASAGPPPPPRANLLGDMQAQAQRVSAHRYRPASFCPVFFFFSPCCLQCCMTCFALPVSLFPAPLSFCVLVPTLPSFLSSFVPCQRKIYKTNKQTIKLTNFQTITVQLSSKREAPPPPRRADPASAGASSPTPSNSSSTGGFNTTLLNKPGVRTICT
jgi:hypothetical protein